MLMALRLKIGLSLALTLCCLGSAGALPIGGLSRDIPQGLDTLGAEGNLLVPVDAIGIADVYEHQGRSVLRLARAIPEASFLAEGESPEKSAEKRVSVLALSPETSIMMPVQLKRMPRIPNLRRILDSDSLQLPLPPQMTQPFSAKVVPLMELDDAISAAISQSYKVAAVESREAYGEAIVGVARAALLPQLKVRATRGKETTSPAADTYSYAKKDICLSPDETTYQDCVAGGTLAYPVGSKVPTNKLLLTNPSAKAPDQVSLLGDTFAYSSIALDKSDVSLSFSQSIFDYGAWAEVAKQKKVHEANKYSVQGERLKVTLDAANSYLKLFQNSLALRFAEDYEAALLSLFERISARVEGGASSEADRERVRGRRVNAQSTVLDARNAVETELTLFQKLTGKRPTRLSLPPEWLALMPESIEAALIVSAESNPALQADLKQAESILDEVRKAKAAFLPNINLEFNMASSTGGGATNVPVLTSDYPVCGTNPETGNAFCSGGDVDRRFDRVTQSLMVIMNWNIFAGGGDYYQVRAAAEKYNEAMFRLLDTRRDLEEKLHANFESLSSTAKRVEEIAKEVESNQKVVASFTEQMFAANRSLLDVLDAHQRLYQSRLDYMRLLIAEAGLAFDILYNTGTLTRIVKRPDDIQSPRGTMGSLVGKDVWRRD
ncbi:MAG: hypothetical protein RIR70_758 [Pseudomonadota bacterium]